jgi:ATP-dependent Lon protease
MAQLGYHPVKVTDNRNEFWYNSPFRVEKEPSFHISFLGGKWIWKDFGDIGGTIVDFAMRYQNDCNVKEALENNDVHIHIPQGATPKDGPSAGIALTAVILSALSNRPIKNEIAMTGEISLRGDVLPIGGVSKKVMGAHMAGVKQILLPQENMIDLEDVPDEIKKELTFTPIKHVKEAIDILLMDEVIEKVSLEQPIN